jgi:hypothetical protein
MSALVAFSSYLLGCYYNLYKTMKIEAWWQWLTLLIPATQMAEIRRIVDVF